MKKNIGKLGWKIILPIIICIALVLIGTAYAGDPVTFELTNAGLAENASPGTQIGDFQLTSANTNPSYSLPEGQGDNGCFTLEGVSLFSAASFDYESTSSLTVVVDVTADNGAAGQETFVIDIIDESPQAGNINLSVSEDGSKSGNLPLSGDNTSVSFSLQSGPSKGSVSINSGSGSFTYTPDADENGDDSFTYKVSDGGSSDTGTVSVSISAQNDAPVITQGDSASLSCQEDGDPESLTLSATDVDNDALSWSVTAQGGHGSAAADADTGTVTYTPTEDNYNGADSFTVTVSDGHGGSDSIAIAVTIEAVNDTPSFTVGSDVNVNEDCGIQSLENWIGSMSAGPADESGQALTFSVTENTNAGLFSSEPAVDGNGTLTFTPDDDLYGTAVITLTVEDSEGGAGGQAQTFSITVDPVNDAPACTKLPQITGTPHNGQTLTADIGSWSDATDGEYAASWDTAYQWQSGGSASGPWNDLAGATGLSYTLTSAENAMYVRIAVTCTDTDPDPKSGTAYSEAIAVLNEAPVFSDGESVSMFFTEDDGTGSKDLPATDSDGDSLSWAVTKQGALGEASISGMTAGYTPFADAYGEDSFIVTVSDGNGGTDTMTVEVTTSAVNDIPSFTVGSDQEVTEDCGAQTIKNWVAAMAAGPENESGQTLIFTVDGNTNAALFYAAPAVDGEGTLTYTPEANAYGTAAITLSLSDSEGADAVGTQTFQITVNSQNDAPANTQAPQITGTPHNGQTLSATAGDWNDDTDGALATELAYAFHWQSAASADGPWSDIAGASESSYTLTSAENDRYIRALVTCTDSDSAPLSAMAASAAVQVRNEAPVISQGTSASITLTEDGTADPLTFDAQDGDGDTLIWTIAAQGAKGAAALEGSTADYTPAADENGEDSFTVSVSDGNGGTDSIIVSVSITAVNDRPFFTAGADQTVQEDCGPQPVDNWVAAKSAGADNESWQTLIFTVEYNTNEALFAAGPAVDGDGNLTYTPAANANGSAVITLSVMDSEGGEGLETHTFTVTVEPVNDAPVNTAFPTVSGTLSVGGTLTAQPGT